MVPQAVPALSGALSSAPSGMLGWWHTLSQRERATHQKESGPDSEEREARESSSRRQMPQTLASARLFAVRFQIFVCFWSPMLATTFARVSIMSMSSC